MRWNGDFSSSNNIEMLGIEKLSYNSLYIVRLCSKNGQPYSCYGFDDPSRSIMINNQKCLMPWPHVREHATRLYLRDRQDPASPAPVRQLLRYLLPHPQRYFQDGELTLFVPPPGEGKPGRT
jgi:hypothetical protein